MKKIYEIGSSPYNVFRITLIILFNLMKKILLSSLVVLLLVTGCDFFGKGYTLTPPEGWSVQEQTEKSFVLKHSDEASPKLTVQVFKKSPKTYLPTWILENNLTINSSFNGECAELLSGKNSNAYNCGTESSEFFVVSQDETHVFMLFQEKEPVLSLGEFQGVINFE